MRAEIARRREALRQQEAERTLPSQILLIILNSIGAAVVSALFAALILNQLPGNSIFVDPEISKLVLVMSFLLAFLLTLLLLMRRLPPNWWQLANEIATTDKYRAPDQKWGGALEDTSSDYVPLFDPTRQVSEVPPTLALHTEATPFGAEPEPQPEADEQSAPDVAAETAKAQALFSAEPESDAERTTHALAQAKKLAVAEIDRLTTALTESIQGAARALDTASRFAMQLYVAGACSTVARKFLLSARDSFALMIRALVQAGTSRTFAESFATNVEEYARRPAYRVLIDEGQTAMDAQLGGGPVAVVDAVTRFERWSTDANKALVPRVVTFLFTDIVDAAALTQRLGNLHAQRVIKAHDDAVSGAIEKFRGRTVKHTGDGTITTFPDPAKAMIAAQQIQLRLDDHNKRMPHLSANVRIGIHAGEAVAENGTFFGAAVKMTAQVCAAAKAGQILASDVVRTFCKTSQSAFTPFGEIRMEELDKNRHVFDVAWAKSAAGLEYADIGHPGA
jgi:class 3 adenylate cyclase